MKITLLAPRVQKVDSAIQLLNNRGQDFIRSEIHIVRSGLFKQKGNTFNPFSMKEEREKGRLEYNFLFRNIRIQILQSTYKFVIKEVEKICYG